MNDQQQEPDRQQLRERYEADHAPDGWVNYGDANPEAHGGIWVSYDPDRDRWEVYETIHAGVYEELDDPEDWGQQYVRRGEVHWQDVLTEDGQFRDGHAGFASHAETFDRAPDLPMGVVIDGYLTKMVAWYAVERAEPYGGEVYGYNRTGFHDCDSYDAVLEAIGVYPDNE